MLQVNERLGDFEIIRLLGKGGMGEVYEARQLNPDRRVALKVLAPWLADDDDSLQRFWREAAVPANLDHPGIVRIISTGKTPSGIAYYTMHLVRGVSLAEMIRRAGTSSLSEVPTRTVESLNTPSAAAPAESEDPPPVSPLPIIDSIPPLMRDYRHDRFETAARIGALAARALAYAHEQGYLHRDIKPSNLMIDLHNQVYLVDFGLTRGLLPSADGTQAGTVIGTPWYMSPEQADGRAVDERSDIYSLGVTLYELATQGAGPFTAARDNKGEVLAQVRAGRVLPLRTLADGIPPVLERIIVRAMDHDPKRRYPSAAGMAQELEAFGGQASKLLSQLAPQSVVQKPRRIGPWTAGLSILGIVLVVLVALAVARFWPDRRDAKLDLLDGSKAEPRSLRQAQTDVGIHLLRVNGEPLFQKIVFGKGVYHPRPLGGDLVLQSMEDEFPTLMLLGNPDRRNFELSIEVDAPPARENAAVKDIGGIFLGWDRPETPTDAARKCIAIQIENHPQEGAPHGGLRAGFFEVTPKGDARGTTITAFQDLPIAKGASIRFAGPPNWRLVQVKVSDQTVLVVTDSGSVEFTIAELRAKNRFISENLSPQGGIGVWAQQGAIGFRKAMITLRP